MRWRIAVALVALATAFACGDGGDPAPVASGERNATGRAAEGDDLVALLSADEGFGEPAAAVIDGVRFLYGGVSTPPGQPVEPADGGVLVTADGAVSSVPPAPVRDLAHVAATGREGTAFLVGSPCATNDGVGDTGELHCEPGGWTLASYSLAEGTWTEAELPPEVATGAWSSVEVHALANSTLVVIARDDDGGALWVRGAEGWSEGDEPVGTPCVADGRLLDATDVPNRSLAAWRRGPGDDPLPRDAAVAFSVRSLDPITGRWREESGSEPVPLVEPLGFHLVCTDAVAVAAVVQADGSTMLLHSAGGEWSTAGTSDLGEADLSTTGYGTVLISRRDGSTAVLDPASGSVRPLRPTLRVRHRFAVGDDAVIGFGLDAGPVPVVSRAS